MQMEFKLPNLGENIPGGDIVHVLATPGMSVTAGSVLLEVETEKAVVEVPAANDMTIQEVHVKPGDHVTVGQTLFLVNAGSGAAPSSAPPAVVAAPPAPETVSIAPSVPPPPLPVLVPPPVANPPPPPPPRSGIPVPAAPSVRREARELGVDIREVPGSGPGGRISMGDVRAWVKERNLHRSSAISSGTAMGDVRVPMHTQLPDFGQWGQVTREKMKNVRRATAVHMAATWNTVPQVTCHDKADITRLESLRQRFSSQLQKGGGKLSVTVIVLKIVATALKKFPQFNASVDMATDEIILKQYVHVGVAVDTPRGLIVPVIRDVDQKSITQLAADLTVISETARAGKTAPEAMRGGCFTVSNLGGIGGVGFTPIVNYPEVAILGMSRSSMEAVYVEGVFQPRLLLPLSLSFDHRLIDGADGARFLRWICEALEEPLLLTL
ncbi:MAG: 2-oxo acid dehydrogenase subunit E2 [Magnetococcales bacterium]|nr:2-oxo acid dehydrogenase subunit E2 [Magnetococcales bacterium]